MKHATAMAAVASLALLALLGGCSSSPASRFYTLGPDTSIAPAPAAAPIRVLVGPVTIPDQVDRPQLVTRVSANEVKINEFARWAEPLKTEVAQVIASDLRAILGSDQVTVVDTSPNGAPAWRVRVDILRLESEPSTAVSMDALWTVLPPAKQPPITGRSVVREPVSGDSFDAIVAAHDRALAAVSRDIAKAIHAPFGQ